MISRKTSSQLEFEAGITGIEDFRLAENPRKTGAKHTSDHEIRGFPQRFPQLWKTLGRDQTRMLGAW
jgi:hypothetical protein